MEISELVAKLPVILQWIDALLVRSRLHARRVDSLRARRGDVQCRATGDDTPVGGSTDAVTGKNPQSRNSKQGLPPVSAPDARVLVLGTLPSDCSLACGEYYAQLGNAFWRIAGELCAFAHALPYNERTAALKAHRVALWDVCAAAQREGSLDAAIRNASANDFAEFLSAHPQLRLIAFNGQEAAKLFRRLVVRQLSGKARAIPTHELPSTSSAHTMTFEKKLLAWRVLQDFSR